MQTGEQAPCGARPVPWNHEVFPVIIDVRDVLRSNGVPIRPGSTLCGGAACHEHSPLVLVLVQPARAVSSTAAPTCTDAYQCALADLVSAPGTTPHSIIVMTAADIFG
jgi:hypothetical protein